MNWVQKHLNWYLFLGVCSLQIAVLPLLKFLSGGEAVWDFWVAFALCVMAYYAIFEYVLSKKGYKYHDTLMGMGWFILWLTGWLGIIVLLLVRNKNGKSGGKQMTDEKNEQEEALFNPL